MDSISTFLFKKIKSSCTPLPRDRVSIGRLSSTKWDNSISTSEGGESLVYNMNYNIICHGRFS